MAPKHPACDILVDVTEAVQLDQIGTGVWLPGNLEVMKPHQVRALRVIYTTILF